MVLSIPFALAQSRKAIPAGRYEALSGVKISHSVKSADTQATKDSLGLFWTEVAKHIPESPKGFSFYSANETDPSLKTFLTSKGVLEAKEFDNKVNIISSDDLARDAEIFKKIKTKGTLVILKDKHGLKDLISTFSRFEIIVFQTDVDANYVLLQLK